MKATVEAQKQGAGNNEKRSIRNTARPSTVSDKEIAQGYRLAFLTNDISHSFAMPMDASYAGNAHIRGAASSFGRNFIGFGEWSFPFGSNDAHYSSAWWFIDGRIRFALRDVHSEISVGVHSPALAMQGESRIWHGAAGEGRYTFCWENIFLGGGTNVSANLQIVMRDDGWFETWSNEVGHVYRRINQYDWDGDGIDNTIDSAPKAYDGDRFGTGIGWLNANCSAILSASLDNDSAIRIEWNTNFDHNRQFLSPGVVREARQQHNSNK